MSVDLDSIVAIDAHTHAEVGRTGADGLRPEWRDAARAYFGEGGTPTEDGVRPLILEANAARLLGLH